MELTVLIPSMVYLEQQVRKVVAEAPDGSFCLLPQHIDCAAALVPGLLGYQDLEGREVFLAVDEGTLVKAGDRVWVSVRHAMGGTDLGRLRETVQREFEKVDEGEKAARSAVTKIEAGFIRRFLEIERNG